MSRENLEIGKIEEIKRLREFIQNERLYLESAAPDIAWEDDSWNTQNWLLNRSKDNKLLFRLLPVIRQGSNNIRSPSKTPLPQEYSDFCKAVVVYFQRTRNLSHMGVRVYVHDLRRVFNLFLERGEVSPLAFTPWHFERTVELMKVQKYSGVYDAATRLQAVAELIDRKRLTTPLLNFQHGVSTKSEYLRYVSITDPQRDEKIRKDANKLPSREALEAYALCTNNPINDGEEILLRTIDLLIAMGQRGNEVACIPFDCWVEHPLKTISGQIIKDANGKPIVEVGIRYYPEKHFETRVHWLADQDVALARRAVLRLKELTTDVREVAKWQEENPGRIWKFSPDEKLHDDELLKTLGYVSKRNLYLFLTVNKKINPIREISDPYSARIDRYYRAGDIETLLAPSLSDHIVLKQKVDGKWKVVLRTSETLSIRFDGAFRFLRIENVFRMMPRQTSLIEINNALGANPQYQSIFDRRKLTEADGQRIALTSHQPRHWRNTLYELAGMSNVQQALAMGRKKLDQNSTYQHTTLKERTESHHDFLTFSSAQEKLSFIHEGIRARRILGGVTDAYHSLKKTKDLATAERFLTMHAQAMHVTPYGACAHDFSQAPCPKHLQCWNNCSHLHRTGRKDEHQSINFQIQTSEVALTKMLADGIGEYGADVWVQDLEKKIKNMKRALAMTVNEIPVPVFSPGESIDQAVLISGRSSVSED